MKKYALLPLLLLILYLGACAPKTVLPQKEQESLLERATQAYANGDCRKSIDLFSVLAQARQHPSVLNGLGMAQLQCGQDLQAIDSFKRAVSLAPGSSALHANLGTAYFAAGNLRSADNSFETALRADPSNPEALLGKASVYLERGEADKALRLLKQLPPAAQQTPEALFDRGLILYKLGIYDDAETVLLQCLEKNGGDAPVYNALAITRLGLNKNELALEDINRAIAADTMDGKYYYNRGNIHKAMKNFTAAIDDYGRAIAYEPQFAEAFVNRGDLLFLQNKKTAACQDLEEACKLGSCERLESFREMGRCQTGIWK